MRQPSEQDDERRKSSEQARILPAILDKEQLEFFAILAAEMELEYHKIVQKVYRSLDHNSLRQSTYDEKLEIIAEWRNLALVIDRLLFTMYVLVISLTTFGFIFAPALLYEQFPSDTHVSTK